MSRPRRDSAASAEHVANCGVPADRRFIVDQRPVADRQPVTDRRRGIDRATVIHGQSAAGHRNHSADCNSAETYPDHAAGFQTSSTQPNADTKQLGATLDAERSAQCAHRPGFTMSARDPSTAGSAWSLITVVASQAVVVTGVLYYFGWAYARAFYAHFAVDLRLLGFSTQDYVLRSLNGGFRPALIALFMIVALIAARQLPEWHAVRRRRPRRVLRLWVAATGAAGAAITASVAAVMFIHLPKTTPPAVTRGLDVWLPIMLIAGVALLGYSNALRMRYRALLGTSRHIVKSEASTLRISTAALIALALVGCFWAVGSHADREGRATARRAEAAHFHDYPSVLIFSVDRLGIEGPGTITGEINFPGERYKWVYSGVWLLARTHDRYILLPQQWKATRDRVFVIPDSDTIRIDIARTPT